jgi:hypothetical protein
MKKTFKTSKFTSMIHLAIGYILRPKTIVVDDEDKSLRILRRNWHFISVDEQYLRAKTIRKIKVDKHIFGATIIYEAWGSKAEISHLKKKDADKIMQTLLGQG